MSAPKLLLRGCVAVLGAIGLTFVTGLANPHEKVNGSRPVVEAG